MTARQYNLYLTWSQKVAFGFPLVMFTVMLLVFLVLFSASDLGEAAKGEFPPFLPVCLNIQAGLSGYILKHQSGKIRFPGQFTGQYMLLYELKQANPQLDIKGC